MHRSVDAWAIGILGFELVVGHPPFERETRTDTYEQIMYRRPNYPAWISEESRTFISAALTKVMTDAWKEGHGPGCCSKREMQTFV